MAREVFILQFDMEKDPNELSCTAIKLEGKSIEFKSIHPLTASDIYEAITGKDIWPSKIEEAKKALIYSREEIENE